MAKRTLPLFTRDHRTGLMKALKPAESRKFTLAGDGPVARHFRVLVADHDEKDRRFTIWHIGQAWPVEQEMVVECAADGDEVLEKVRSRRFGLVVLDWNIPRRAGADVVRTIRRDGQRIPIVVLSGHNREVIAGDLECLSAAFMNKCELNPYSFGNAIATSIHLQAVPCPATVQMQLRL